jgi:hypothetical protein
VSLLARFPRAHMGLRQPCSRMFGLAKVLIYDNKLHVKATGTGACKTGPNDRVKYALQLCFEDSII